MVTLKEIESAEFKEETLYGVFVKGYHKAHRNLYGTQFEPTLTSKVNEIIVPRVSTVNSEILIFQKTIDIEKHFSNIYVYYSPKFNIIKISSISFYRKRNYLVNAFDFKSKEMLEDIIPWLDKILSEQEDYDGDRYLITDGEIYATSWLVLEFLERLNPYRFVYSPMLNIENTSLIQISDKHFINRNNITNVELEKDGIKIIHNGANYHINNNDCLEYRLFSKLGFYPEIN